MVRFPILYLHGHCPFLGIRRRDINKANLTQLLSAVARGSTVLAKSVTESRIKENLKIVDLDDNEVKLLTEGTAKKRYVYPPFGINFGFPDKLEGKKMKNGVPE